MNLLDLPTEVLFKVFRDFYGTWSLEITLRRDILIESYFDKPKVLLQPKTPSIRPMLICKELESVATSALLDRFSGIISLQEFPKCSSLMSPYKIFNHRVKYIYGPSEAGLTGFIQADLIQHFPNLKIVELFPSQHLFVQVTSDVFDLKNDLIDMDSTRCMGWHSALVIYRNAFCGTLAGCANLNVHENLAYPESPASSGTKEYISVALEIKHDGNVYGLLKNRRIERPFIAINVETRIEHAVGHRLSLAGRSMSTRTCIA